jgi:hypothetical protein
MINSDKVIYQITLIFHIIIILIYLNEHFKNKNEKLQSERYYNLTPKQRKETYAPYVTPFDQVHKTSRTLLGAFWGAMVIYVFFFG